MAREEGEAVAGLGGWRYTPTPQHLVTVSSDFASDFALMYLSLLKSKLHMAAVTQTELAYQGSITIDPVLMDAVGLRPYEKVLVSNCANGLRGETYVIKGKKGKRDVQLNGAMARLAQPGDRIIVMAFAHMTPEEAEGHHPVVAILDEGNRITETIQG